MPLLPNIPSESEHGRRGAPHSSGFPTNALLSMDLNKFPLGIEPEIELKDTLRSCKLEEVLKFAGIGPLMLLCDRSTTPRTGMLASCSGIGPDKLLLDNFMISRFLQFEIVNETVPNNLFLSSSMLESDLQDSNDGRFPEISHEDAEKFCRSGKDQVCAGIVPPNSGLLETLK